METARQRRPLTQLNFEIEQLEAERVRLEREQASIATEARRAARRLNYLRLARWIRRPTTQFDLWPLALVTIGGGLTGLLLVVLASFFTGSLPFAALSFLAGIGAGAAMAAALLYRPSDLELPVAIHEAESSSRLASARLREKAERITETVQRLQDLVDERRDQIATGKLQRAALLQRNWKGMRQAEWTDFVVEVLRTHGAAVERHGSDGDNSVLIVDINSRRIALLTSCGSEVVSSEGIHMALAAKDQHQCDACAVVINRRFTGAAQDFAGRNGCTAIGASEFPDFVLGKISL